MEERFILGNHFAVSKVGPGALIVEKSLVDASWRLL